MKSIRLLVVALTVFSFGLDTIVDESLAHPGNTAADGCHYCRTNCDQWGEAWNERHCHGAPDSGNSTSGGTSGGASGTGGTGTSGSNTVGSTSGTQGAQAEPAPAGPTERQVPLPTRALPAAQAPTADRIETDPPTPAPALTPDSTDQAIPAQSDEGGSGVVFFLLLVIGGGLWAFLVARRRRTTASGAATVRAVSPALSPAALGRCGRCGEALASDRQSRFCPSCGGPVQQTLTCAGCGRSIDPDFRFCDGCGTPTDRSR